MEGPLSEIVAKKILKEYIVHERASGSLRSQLESPGTSQAGARHGLDDDQREEAMADTALLQQEFGGDSLLLLDSKFPDR